MTVPEGRCRYRNTEAEEITLRDIDRAEVLRIVEAARSTGRLLGAAGRSLPDLLDRLGVRRNGVILRAAVVLFGKRFMPDYPQCELRMARFRGTDKTEFLDQRHSAARPSGSCRRPSCSGPSLTVPCEHDRR